MPRLNEDLDRAAAKKGSYRELNDDDKVESPESPVQQRPVRKRKAAAASEHSQRPQKQKKQDHADASSDDESDSEQRDPAHASSANSRERIDHVIQDLVKKGKDTLMYCDTTPLKSEPQVRPPPLDLGLIKSVTDELLFLDDSVLYGYLTSNDFLPYIAQWKKECIDDIHMRALLLAAFPDDGFPFKDIADFLTKTAPKYVTFVEENSTPNHPHAKIMFICMKYVRRLKRCTMAHFMHFLRESEYPRLEEFVYKFCTQALLTAYADLRLHGMDGFFAVMLDSRFAEPMTLEARRAWDKLLILPGSSSGTDTAAKVSTIQAASIAYAKDTGFKSLSTSLNAEETLVLQQNAQMDAWQLKNKWIEAVGENPELMMTIPQETGQTELQKARKHEKKAGRPQRYEREPDVKCEPGCNPKKNDHNDECLKKQEEVVKANKKTKASDIEADVPDQEPNFTFQQKQSTLIPPEQVISRFNQRDVVEPFSDKEKLVALKRFRMALDLRKGDMIDGAFEWTMISEVLAGRSVADCVRFYYQHKHLIFMKLEKAPSSTVPPVLSGTPEWSPFLPAQVQARVRQIFDIDRFLEHIATIEGDNTALRIRNDQLEALMARWSHSDKFHRERGDKHKANWIKLAASDAERAAENEKLKKQLAESKAHAEEQEKLVADGKKLSEWQDVLVSESKGREERLKEELKDIKEQLEAAKSQDKDQKPEEEAKVEQPAGTYTYGKIPGFSFLEGKQYTPVKKPWHK